jgi:hypothetical protein
VFVDGLSGDLDVDHLYLLGRTETDSRSGFASPDRRTCTWPRRARSLRCRSINRLMILASGFGRLRSSAAGQLADLLFAPADAVSEGVERGAQQRDLLGDAGEGSAVIGAATVVVDDGAHCGLAVEGGAAQPGDGGDGGEGDGLAVVAELSACSVGPPRALALLIRPGPG